MYMAGNSYRRIEAVKKTADVIKYLAAARQPMTGQEVAEGVGMPTGTTMCHLISLADAGFVQQIGEGWQLGMGLALVWARVKSNLESSRDRAGRDLERIAIGGE
jgi:DNA-binding IclR family transcriptional regulator